MSMATTHRAVTISTQDMTAVATAVSGSSPARSNPRAPRRMAKPATPAPTTTMTNAMASGGESVASPPDRGYPPPRCAGGYAGTLAADLAAALDPVVLARRALGTEPDSWQRRLLRSTAPRVLLNVTRQGGKSTTAAVLAVHQALYAPGSLVLLVSPSERQSGELFGKCLATYRAAGATAPSVHETTQLLTLANGSRIVSLPGKEGTIRGYSGVSLIVEDEAARAADELYLAVRPMLAVSGGRLILMSTPFGKRGHFFEAWTNGGPSWERYEVPATECPRISPAFLAEERRALPDRWYRQEYGCSFEETVDQVFSYDDIEAALSDVPPLLPLLSQGVA